MNEACQGVGPNAVIQLNFEARFISQDIKLIITSDSVHLQTLFTAIK